MTPHPFPRLRWLAAAWLAVWAPAYAVVWGWANFLHLCDVAVILTCAGLIAGSPLLLSSQAVASMVVDVVWDLDLAWRLVTGAHLVGGTEYMWDDRFPLAVRLLSLFHVVWPPLLLYAVQRVGYDRRGFALQCGVALVFAVAGRLAAGPEANINFAYRDPFLRRAWGPAPVHVVAMVAALGAIVYWPTHKLLARWTRPST